MSPEVLTQKPITDKVDIYSFAIVLWEMLAEQEPYADHDSYTTFVRAICGKHERPPIPSTWHASIRELLQLSWHHDPKMRPSFSEIIDMLNVAMVDCSVSDDTAAAIWKENWCGELHVPFSRFAPTLYHSLGIPLVDKQRNLEYKCLQAILAKEDSGPPMVALEKFSFFTKWFGKLHQTDKKGNDITVLQVLLNIMQKPWFHGDITRHEAEALLGSFKSKGTYLIRVSTTTPDKYPFTISKVYYVLKLILD